MNRLMPIALAALAIVVMVPMLGSVPVYLHHDEVFYALHAHAIATTGHDLNGQRLPLFLFTVAWVPPISIYVRALTYMVAPLSEATIRLPGVFIGALNVLLTYVVGRHLFGNVRFAALAAGFVLLTPTHFIHARLAVDHIWGLPFALGFLWGLVTYLQHRRLSTWFAANACLAVGLYGYNGSLSSTPLFFGLGTIWLFVVERVRTPRVYVAGLAGFVLPLLPLLPWFLAHPTQLTDQLRFYGVGANVATRPAWMWLAARLDLYYYFFNPAILFLEGDPSLIDSTREAGVFLLPFAVLLPLGAYHILTKRRSSPDHFMLLAFLAAPLSAIAVDDVKVTRVLAMVPLAGFIAARGVEELVSRGSAVARTAAAILLAGSLWQFHLFSRDYFGEYGARSAVWFERNRAGGVEALLARADAAPAVYISDTIPMVRYFWHFYAIKHRRPDLIPRAVYVDRTFDAEAAPAGSLLLKETGGADGDRDLIRTFMQVAVVHDLDGTPSFAIHRK